MPGQGSQNKKEQMKNELVRLQKIVKFKQKRLEELQRRNSEIRSDTINSSLSSATFRQLNGKRSNSFSAVEDSVKDVIDVKRRHQNIVAANPVPRTKKDSLSIDESSKLFLSNDSETALSSVELHSVGLSSAHPKLNEISCDKKIDISGNEALNQVDSEDVFFQDNLTCVFANIATQEFSTDQDVLLEEAQKGLPECNPVVEKPLKKLSEVPADSDCSVNCDNSYKQTIVDKSECEKLEKSGGDAGIFIKQAQDTGCINSCVEQDTKSNHLKKEELESSRSINVEQLDESFNCDDFLNTSFSDSVLQDSDPKELQVESSENKSSTCVSSKAKDMTNVDLIVNIFNRKNHIPLSTIVAKVERESKQSMPEERLPVSHLPVMSDIFTSDSDGRVSSDNVTKEKAQYSPDGFRIPHPLKKKTLNRKRAKVSSNAVVHGSEGFSSISKEGDKLAQDSVKSRISVTSDGKEKQISSYVSRYEPWYKKDYADSLLSSKSNDMSKKNVIAHNSEFSLDSLYFKSLRSVTNDAQSVADGNSPAKNICLDLVPRCDIGVNELFTKESCRSYDPLCNAKKSKDHKDSNGPRKKKFPVPRSKPFYPSTDIEPKPADSSEDESEDPVSYRWAWQLEPCVECRSRGITRDSDLASTSWANPYCYEFSGPGTEQLSDMYYVIEEDLLEENNVANQLDDPNMNPPIMDLSCKKSWKSTAAAAAYDNSSNFSNSLGVDYSQPQFALSEHDVFMVCQEDAPVKDIHIAIHQGHAAVICIFEKFFNANVLTNENIWENTFFYHFGYDSCITTSVVVYDMKHACLVVAVQIEEQLQIKIFYFGEDSKKPHEKLLDSYSRNRWPANNLLMCELTQLKFAIVFNATEESYVFIYKVAFDEQNSNLSSVCLARYDLSFHLSSICRITNSASSLFGLGDNVLVIVNYEVSESIYTVQLNDSFLSPMSRGVYASSTENRSVIVVVSTEDEQQQVCKLMEMSLETHDCVWRCVYSHNHPSDLGSKSPLMWRKTAFVDDDGLLFVLCSCVCIVFDMNSGTHLNDMYYDKASAMACRHSLCVYGNETGYVESAYYINKS